jgi:hypothetical protein
LSSEISIIGIIGKSKNTRFFNVGKDVAYTDIAGAAVGATGGSAVEAVHSFIKWLINW